MTEKPEVYEYAGFQYRVTRAEDGTPTLTAMPGQHSAAYKDKHLRAARELFNAEEHVRSRK